jgi:hypothetical protein
MLKYCKRRFREIAVLVVALLLPSGLWGQNPPAPRTESIPTVQFRLRSLTELLNKAEYTAGLVDQAEAIRAVKALIFLARLQGKGVEGIHPDKPFGFYAHVKPDLVSSSFVIMIPFADRDSLLNLLKGQLGCTVENQRENCYKLTLPAQFPLMSVGIDHLYLRFERDYLYVGRFAEDLEEPRLIPAKTFFAPDDEGAALSLKVRLDQISVDVKRFLLAQLEMFLEQGMRQNPPEDDVGKRLAPWLKNHLINLTQSVTLDAEEVSFQVYIDEKKGELATELRLIPKRGTLLADNLRAFAERKSLPAGIVQSVPQVAMRGGINVGLTPLARREFAQLVQDIAGDAIKNATPEEREFVEGLFQAILPTLKAAELDAATVLLPADRQGHHKLLAAVGVQQGKEIEKFLKSIAPILTTVELADFSFDRETLGDFRIHKVIVNGLPERADQLFGTTTLWLAVSDRCLAWSIEENGELLRSALKKAQTVQVPLVDVEVSAATLLPVLAPELHPDEIKAIRREVFGDTGGRIQDRIRFRVTAGDRFTLRLEGHGSAIRLLHIANVFQLKP